MLSSTKWIGRLEKRWRRPSETQEQNSNLNHAISCDMNDIMSVLLKALNNLGDAVPDFLLSHIFRISISGGHGAVLVCVPYLPLCVPLSIDEVFQDNNYAFYDSVLLPDVITSSYVSGNILFDKPDVRLSLPFPGLLLANFVPALGVEDFFESIDFLDVSNLTEEGDVHVFDYAFTGSDQFFAPELVFILLVQGQQFQHELVQLLRNLDFDFDFFHSFTFLVEADGEGFGLSHVAGVESDGFAFEGSVHDLRAVLHFIYDDDVFSVDSVPAFSVDAPLVDIVVFVPTAHFPKQYLHIRYLPILAGIHQYLYIHKYLNISLGVWGYGEMHEKVYDVRFRRDVGGARKGENDSPVRDNTRGYPPDNRRLSQTKKLNLDYFGYFFSATSDFGTCQKESV